MRSAVVAVMMLACTETSRGRIGVDARDDASVAVDAEETDVGEDVADSTEVRPTPDQWVGLWLVDQPSHALYESTFYRLHADGSVTIGPSDPPDCGIHLERHCVTGSVARSLTEGPSCVFGDRWWSPGPDRLAFAGVCDDGLARDIVLAIDPLSVTSDGFTPTVESVGGESGWVHDNFDWRFLQCPSDTDTTRAYCCTFPDTCAE